MKSSELFQTAPKPTESESNTQNQSEPNEPISVRKSHLSPRENEFDRGQQQPESVVPQETGAEPEVLTVDEMLEMEDAELKSYGIDDPKTWKSYQRLLHKKEAEWKVKEAKYEKTLAQINVSRATESNLNQPPREQNVSQNAPLTKPVRPQRPVNYDSSEAVTDPNSESARYLVQMDRYRDEKDAYQDTVIAQLTGYVGEEQRTKIQQRRREEVKSQSLSRFQQRGLTAKDASQLYDQIEQAYMSDAETGADIFVNLFKGGNSNGSDLTKSVSTNTGKRKLPDNIILPPGVNASTAKPAESNTKSFMQSIQGGNQTRRIILNREKRR
jgi:hypothetical protein